MTTVVFLCIAYIALMHFGSPEATPVCDVFHNGTCPPNIYMCMNGQKVHNDCTCDDDCPVSQKCCFRCPGDTCVQPNWWRGSSGNTTSIVILSRWQLTRMWPTSGWQNVGVVLDVGKRDAQFAWLSWNQNYLLTSVLTIVFQTCLVSLRSQTMKYNRVSAKRLFRPEVILLNIRF
jgi:hypothetical protein